MLRGEPGVPRTECFDAGQRMPSGFAVLVILIPLLILSCGDPDAGLDRTATTCTECVRVSPVTTLSSAEAAFVPSTVQNVVSTVSGGFAVSHPFGDPVVAIYDHDGHHVRLAGRRGEGPGEFTRGLFLLPGLGDTILAPEPTMHRLHRFAGDFDFVDTRRIDLEVVGTGVSLTGGRLVVDDVRAVHPDGSHALVSILTLVHLVDAEAGEILASARVPVAALPVGGNATLLFSAAPDAMGHVETRI
jgi:hypothetical protein